MSVLTDYAWAAGFLDGEGYLTVQRKNPSYGIRRSGPNVGRPRKEGYTYTLTIMATNNNSLPIDRLVTIFGGRNAPVHRTNKRDYFRWRLCGDAALAALEAMLPFLVGKHALASVCIGFQRWYTATTPEWGKNMAPDRRAQAECYRQECCRLIRLYRIVPEGASVARPASAEGHLIATGSEG